MRAFGLLLATGGYAGYSPVAPGTAGSVVGLLLLVGVRSLGTAVTEFVLLLGVVAVGVWASSVGERHAGHKDPGIVVIDEVAGMLLTMFLLPLTWSTAIVGFLVFRLVDITKPFPIRVVEHLPGGMGIMADDLIAAVYASIVLRLFIWLEPLLVPA